jgi:hypothetical protein
LVVDLRGVDGVGITVLLVVESAKRLLGRLRFYSEILVRFHDFDFMRNLFDFSIWILYLECVGLDRLDIHGLVVFNDIILNKVVTVLLEYLLGPVENFLPNDVALYIYVLFEVLLFEKKDARAVNSLFT